jgi:hypothetical protein
MARVILHVVDENTPMEALETLARIVQGGGEQRVVGMGHRVTGKLAARAGINTMQWVPSLGWSDPGGWHGIKRVIEELKPSHVHAWGVSGVVATAMARFRGRRVASFFDGPSWSQSMAIRFVNRASAGWTWVGSSPSVVAALQTAVPGARVTEVRPAVSAINSHANSPQNLRHELEIGADDGPVILLGGEGRRARHDYGLWAGAILQQIYPRMKVIVRDDLRERKDPGLMRFLDALPQDTMVVIASPERSWEELLAVTNILLVTPDGPMGTGSMLKAMAMGVAVVGTPVACVSEVVRDGENGLLTKEVKPRSIAARLETFLADRSIHNGMIERARATVAAEYSVPAMLSGYAKIYAE